MPKNIKKLIEKFYPEDNIILYDNFDEALVGVVEGFDGIPRACYDYKKCINIIIEDMERGSDVTDVVEDKYMEAVEYFQFNVIGGYVGRATPVFLNRLE
tara:strand:- start:37 stop:333 length:297 start_codon:yes stop_codon:yes gene_type:complete